MTVKTFSIRFCDGNFISNVQIELIQENQNFMLFTCFSTKLEICVQFYFCLQKIKIRSTEFNERKKYFRKKLFKWGTDLNCLNFHQEVVLI